MPSLQGTLPGCNLPVIHGTPSVTVPHTVWRHTRYCSKLNAQHCLPLKHLQFIQAVAVQALPDISMHKSLNTRQQQRCCIGEGAYQGQQCASCQ